VSGDYAYVADGEHGLRVIDISSPGNAHEVGDFATGGYAESVEMLGRVAIVARGDAGVVLVDCNTPSDPIELASYATYGWATDVDVVHNHAYVLENGWGLTVLKMWHTFKDVLFSNWAFREIEEAWAKGITLGYPDELYHPEFVCSRDQMAVFVARALAGGDDNVPDPPAGTQSFFDVPSTGYGTDGTDPYWAYKYIEYCFDQGVVEGYVDPQTKTLHYRPLFTVTRDMMAVFMARAVAGGDASVPDAPPCDPMEPLFLDIPCEHWAYKYIYYCVHADELAGLPEPIVRGYDDGYYRPTLAVMRDQMAVFIYRAFPES